MLSTIEAKTAVPFVRSVMRAGRYFGRRRVVLAGLFFTVSLFSYKQAVAPTRNDGGFLRLSRVLTGRDVDEDLAQRFFEAFLVQDAEFSDKLGQLTRSIASQAAMSIDALDMSALSPAAQACALTIISAWYTGVVGAGPEAAVVTFQSAFLYDATRDALVVPTYCGWKSRYWTQAPPPAPMTGFTVPRLRFPIWLRW